MTYEVDAAKVKTTFYPMAGSVGERFANFLLGLRWMNDNTPAPEQFIAWLRERFDLSFYFARDIYTVLFVSSGLTQNVQHCCVLTDDGRAVLQAGSPALLLEAFERSFVGVAAILEIVRDRDGIEVEALRASWFEIVAARFPQTLRWSAKTIAGQFRHRTDWLRALGFLDVAAAKFVLTSQGHEFVSRQPPELIAVTIQEIGAQASDLQQSAASKPFVAFGSSAHFTTRQTLVRDRAFGRIVCGQYNYSCAVCSFRLSSPRGAYAAEGAHIIPKSKNGSDDPRNGLCLCPICHWAFDEGLISVRPTVRLILISQHLQGQEVTLAQRANQPLRSNLDAALSPSDEAFDWHQQHVFLG